MSYTLFGNNFRSPSNLWPKKNPIKTIENLSISIIRSFDNKIQFPI